MKQINKSNKKYVLFSPIGNHDPFGKTKDAITEGPLLHIIRHYQPEQVILFLTKEMFQKQEKDSRYTKNIEKLFPDCKVEIIENGQDIENAHEFDEFITPFKNIFETIQDKYPDHEILLNVSSGTPQMISSLVLEAQITNIKIKSIQVITPLRKSNNDDRYQEDDIKCLVQEIENNDNRCREPQFNYFKKMKLKSQLQILINNYEYKSALKLIEQERTKLFSNEIIDLISHLSLRANFDDNCKEYAKNYKLDKKEFEYFYTIKLKQKKGELMDMVLKITPFINNLLRAETEKFYKLVYDADFYELISIDTTTKSKTEIIKRDTLENKRPDLLEWLDVKFKKKYNDGFIKNITLKYIFDYLIEQYEFLLEKDKNSEISLSKKFNRLMDLETNIRNKIAHELTYVNEKNFKKIYNGSSKEVIKDLEKILVATRGFKIGQFIYDDLNKELLKML